MVEIQGEFIFNYSCFYFGQARRTANKLFFPGGVAGCSSPGYTVLMKYSLAFVALPAGSSRQRARCVKTGRFVSWAVAPLLRIAVPTPAPTPCTVPLLDRVVVVVVAFLVALVTVSPLPLVALPLVALVAVALVAAPSPAPPVAGGGGRDPPAHAPAHAPAGDPRMARPHPPHGAREGEKMSRPWRRGGVSYGDVGKVRDLWGVAHGTHKLKPLRHLYQLEATIQYRKRLGREVSTCNGRNPSKATALIDLGLL